MRILLQFKCETCGEEMEVLQRRDDPHPQCQKGHGPLAKAFVTPAFTFKVGHSQGTSGGHTMRIAGKKK